MYKFAPELHEMIRGNFETIQQLVLRTLIILGTDTSQLNRIIAYITGFQFEDFTK